MEKHKYKYVYDGPVIVFDKCVTSHWKGETYALSAEKAKSNLTYQYKKQNNLLPGTKVTLTGKVTEATWKERVS